MEPNDFTPQLRARLFNVMTGRDGNPLSGTVADRLAAAFGPGKRGGRVNVAAAAKALGVTPRTVQRWVSGEIRTPRPAKAREIDRRARQAATTKRGRKVAMAQRRAARISPRGAQLVVGGKMGPGTDLAYQRRRIVRHQLSPEAIEAMQVAYEEGGHEGLIQRTEEILSSEYLDDFTISDINDFRID